MGPKFVTTDATSFADFFAIALDLARSLSTDYVCETEEDGIPPTLLLWNMHGTDSTIAFLPVPFYTEADKNRLEHMLAVVRKHRTPYTLITEAFKSCQLDLMPSQDPEREEVLTVQGYDSNGDTHFATAPITRKGFDRTVGAWEGHSDGMGRFLGNDPGKLDEIKEKFKNLGVSRPK